MSQDIDSRAGARPLPGLIKLYLLWLYPLAVSLLCARPLLAAARMEDEPAAVIWSLIFLAFGIGCLAVIAGLHARAVWAPRAAVYLNYAATAICLGAIIHIFAVMPGLRQLRYIIRESEWVYILLFPAILGMNMPIFYAWARYFSASPKAAEAFGCAPSGSATLPSLGFALLQVLCAAYIAFAAVFALSFFVIGGWDLIRDGGYMLLINMLPIPLFMALIFWFSSGTGRSAWPLFAVLGIFAGFMLIWQRLPYIFIMYLHDIFEQGEVFPTLGILNTVPMPVALLVFIIGILAWKIWADPAEQSKFKDGCKSVRTLDMFTLYGIILLYYCVISALNCIQVLMTSDLLHEEIATPSY